MSLQPVLIDGNWTKSRGTKTFQAINPATKQPLEHEYPVSSWEEIDQAMLAAAAAFEVVRDWPGERFAAFLEKFAEEIEQNADAIVEAAHLETAYPISPRLKDVELARTTNQLRLAAEAARTSSWSLPTIDTKANIRSMLEPIGPVAVFGPNNFPLAFNSIAGGDFAAAVAAGNPVLAKGHPSHPRTTQLLGEAAQKAAEATEMPSGFVQLIYRTSHDDGAKLVSHPALGASGYTGSRHAGLILKAAADRAGKPIYLELSSINPVFILPGALEERAEAIIGEFAASSLMGTGQFCTNPGVLFLRKGQAAEAFITAIAERFKSSSPGTLLGENVEQSLRAGIVALQQAGAEIVVGNEPADADRCCYANTLLRATGKDFLANPQGLQEEAFGNASLIVVAEDNDQLVQLTDVLEGNLTGCIYSATKNADEELYQRVERGLRPKVGRLLNDKMPTGVAVSSAMNHGGPYPSTGHAGFTAVGIPASLRRFGVLQCYDNVRESRLPTVLKNQSPSEKTWRLVDGQWTHGDVPENQS